MTPFLAAFNDLWLAAFGAAAFCTYRTGAAQCPAGALAMAAHLLQQTLDAPTMAIAAYYQRGADCGPDPDHPLTQIGQMVAAGAVTFEEALAALVVGPLADADARAKDEPMRDAIARLVVRGDMEFNEALEYLTDARRDMRRLMTEAEAGLDGSDLLAARVAVGRCWHGMGDTDGLALKLMDREIKAGRLDPNDGEAMRAAEDRYERIAREWGKRASWSDAVLAEAPKLREAMERVKAQREAVIEAERAELRRVVEWSKARRDALSQTMAEIRPDMNRKLGDLLGIEPGMPLNREQIAHLLNGRRVDGAAIDGKTYSVLRRFFDRATGRDRFKVPLGFTDVCLQSGKSIGVAYMGATMKGLHAEANLILAAHREAAHKAMLYVEHLVGHVGTGHAGQGPRERGKIAWVAFDHMTARPTVKIKRTDPVSGERYTELATLKVAGDPHVHTHFAVPNAVLTESGRVVSFDLDTLKGNIHKFGAYYQAQMATALRKRGFEAHLDPETGEAWLAGIDRRLADAFSKRTEKGNDAARAYARERGFDWDKLTPEAQSKLVKSAVQTNRQAKSHATPEAKQMQLHDGQVWEKKDDLSDWKAWQAQAAELGWTYQSLVRPEHVRGVPEERERIEIARAASLPLVDGAFGRNARVWDQDLQVLACRGLVESGITDWTDIDRVTATYREYGVTQDGQTTGLTWGRAMDSRGRWRVGVTTHLHEAQERELIALARDAAADRSRAIPADRVAEMVRQREALPVKDGGLRFAGDHGKRQREIIDHIAEGRRFSLFIGVAGAGKSAIISVPADAWRAQGRTVFGLALAWEQTDELARAGIDQDHRMAVAKFLHKRTPLGKLGLDARSVVVIDEIGQLGTRQMLEVLRMQARIGFQIVAMGDPKQCQSIEAGPVIDLLRRALGENAVPQILTTRRQESEREQEIVGKFRAGEVDAALRMKREDGTVTLVPGDREAAIAEVADRWQALTEAGRAEDPDYSVTVFAPTNADARDISAAIRVRKQAMKDADGKPMLGPDAKVLTVSTPGHDPHEIRLAAGDVVRTYNRVVGRIENPDKPHPIAVRNGQTWGVGVIANNGSMLEVLDVMRDRMRVRNARTGKIGVVSYESLRDPFKAGGDMQLAHGYVSTIHSGQGKTADEHIDALVSGSAAIDNFQANVTETRHRRRSFMIVSESAERMAITNARPMNDPRVIREKDVWDNIARNLSRAEPEESATAFRERARGLRTRAVEAFQGARQRTEARRAAGRAAGARARMDVAAVARGVAQAAEALRASGERFARVVETLPSLGAAVRAAVERARSDRTTEQDQGRGPEA